MTEVKVNDPFSSAQELISRRDQLRELTWDKRVNRFTSIEAKNSIKERYDALLGNWDFALAIEYYKLLKDQVKEINKVLAENPPTISGIQLLTNVTIDTQSKKWYDDMTPVLESMALDFAYFQVDLLLPEGLKSNWEFSEEQQERIERARRRKPREEIIKDGFFPLRKRGKPIPININKYNRASKRFVADRLDQFVPDMSKTMKKNLNLALRKGLDEANALGLTGRQLEDHIRKSISKSLGKKNLGRAMNIARTEGTAISNYGMLESAKATGLQLMKEWITIRDGKVRDAHYLVEGDQVPQSEDFNVMGYAMSHPGDSRAPAGLVCNCRCSMIFHEVRL